MSPKEALKVCKVLEHLAKEAVSPYQKTEIYAAFAYYAEIARLDKDFITKMQLLCLPNKKSMASVLKEREKT